MYSRNAIINCIALFFIVSPTSSIHEKSQKHFITNKIPSAHQDSGGSSVRQQPADYSYHYRPFASAPDHIKQLIHQAYTPQGPYVNPHAFFYNINPPTTYQDSSSNNFVMPKSTIADPSPSQSPITYRTVHKEVSPAQTIARVSKIPKQSGIRYKSDVNSRNSANYFPQQEQTKRSAGINSSTREFSNEVEHQDKGHPMLSAIQQLLQYQAQIPYNVLANYILFQPQKPFVPKPLPKSVIEHSGSYPNQVYYLKPDGEIFPNGDDFMSVMTHEQES